ncbi:hypothetical protein CERZMDRAFT_41485 [Cercospora zeae-maydis SCOH1-5]|uniref:Tyrosine--tRNA ligase n=1 Tax=Cercospora zeae-maydis SCOH1-5 TaxID=717836 RepID=A0A6A6FGG5_9PEZI|nr:hypothetical protein CERZMDRAFT_41485 [Cercospora zeae-maydis SCOH1-5]
MPRPSLSRLLARRPYVCQQCARSFHKSASPFRQQSALSLLEERGLINQIAGDRDALNKILESRNVGFYAGIDPTAPSLHLGHLLPFMPLFWLYYHGHHVVSLVGGATAKVGDPSGRLTSRAKATEDAIQKNFESMFGQVQGLWGNVLKYGERHGLHQNVLGKKEVLNNAEWLDGLNVLKFLRMMGNGARLGAMLSRDTVKNKMEKGDGMSFAEFTYPLLQAWDWWQMYEERGVQVQIGGGDQYGNIIAGVDAVKYIAQSHAQDGAAGAWLDTEGRLKEDHSPMGVTVPLLTTSSGEKFGKSAGNAVWLDPSMTKPFDLYGFLLRSADDDVERYLKLFTFVPVEDIAKIMAEQREAPGKRTAQHLLASEVLELVHGAEIAKSTRAEHEASRKLTFASLTRATEADQASAQDAASRIQLPKSLVHDTPFSRILYHAGLVGTKSEGARTITKGGVYVATAASHSMLAEGDQLHFVPLQKEQSAATVITNGLIVLRLGKWKVRVIEIVDDVDFDGDAPGWEEWKAAKETTQ